MDKTQSKSIISKSIIEDTRVSKRNQTVVPAKIRRALRIKSGDQLSWRLIPSEKQPKILVEPKPKDWAQYTRGLGKKVWENIDADKYLQTLRQEWEE